MAQLQQDAKVQSERTQGRTSISPQWVVDLYKRAGAPLWDLVDGKLVRRA